MVLERIATTPTETDGEGAGGHLNESAFVAVPGVVSMGLDHAGDRTGHRVDDCGEAAGRARDHAKQLRVEVSRSGRSARAEALAASRALPSSIPPFTTTLPCFLISLSANTLAASMAASASP